MINSEVIDQCVLAEAFSSYSEEELKRWGIRDFKTLEVQIENMKRVFRMRLDVLTDTDCEFFFRDPSGAAAVRLKGDYRLEKEDVLFITYTVTAYPGDGPDSCQVRSPSGKMLTVNLYSLVA